MNEIQIDSKLYCVKNCLEKGIETVTITKIYKPGIYWADNDGYPYLKLDGCLLRALFLEDDAFVEYEQAAKKAAKIYQKEIRRLEKEKAAIAKRIEELQNFLIV